MDASVTVRGYSIQSGNSVYKSSVIGRDLTPSRIQETWEKMHRENKHGQMTLAELPPTKTGGSDKNEGNILWARRCFCKAREMVTTLVIKWGEGDNPKKR